MNYGAMIPKIADPFTHSAERKFRARLSASSDPTMKRPAPVLSRRLQLVDRLGQGCTAGAGELSGL